MYVVSTLSFQLRRVESLAICMLILSCPVQSTCRHLRNTRQSRTTPSTFLSTRHIAATPLCRTRTGSNMGCRMLLNRCSGRLHRHHHPLHRRPFLSHQTHVASRHLAHRSLFSEGTPVATELWYTGLASSAITCFRRHQCHQKCLREATP